MREISTNELGMVSGGVENGKFEIEAGVDKERGACGMMRITFEFGDKPETPANDGDEPAFTATAMRPKQP